ncbi:hypothetical protein HUJ04_005468, partial [Dendroctonus ponderosae]
METASMEQNFDELIGQCMAKVKIYNDVIVRHYNQIWKRPTNYVDIRLPDDLPNLHDFIGQKEPAQFGQPALPVHKENQSVLSGTLSTLIGLLKGKLEEQIKTREEEQGFKKDTSATDAIFITKQIKENVIELLTPAFVCFVNLTKIFDRVPLEHAIKVLWEKEAPANIVSM